MQTVARGALRTRIILAAKRWNAHHSSALLIPAETGSTPEIVPFVFYLFFAPDATLCRRRHLASPVRGAGLREPVLKGLGSKCDRQNYVMNLLPIPHTLRADIR